VREGFFEGQVNVFGGGTGGGPWARRNWKGEGLGWVGSDCFASGRGGSGAEGGVGRKFGWRVFDCAGRLERNMAETNEK
jgi:hypothetical protein